MLLFEGVLWLSVIGTLISLSCLCHMLQTDCASKGLKLCIGNHRIIGKDQKGKLIMGRNSPG